MPRRRATPTAAPTTAAAAIPSAPTMAAAATVGEPSTEPRGATTAPPPAPPPAPPTAVATAARAGRRRHPGDVGSCRPQGERVAILALHPARHPGRGRAPPRSRPPDTGDIGARTAAHHRHLVAAPAGGRQRATENSPRTTSDCAANSRTLSANNEPPQHHITAGRPPARDEASLFNNDQSLPAATLDHHITRVDDSDLDEDAQVTVPARRTARYNDRLRTKLPGPMRRVAVRCQRPGCRTSLRTEVRHSPRRIRCAAPPPVSVAPSLMIGS